MILHWELLALHYGPEINTHRARFETAGQTTFGLLCCRFSPEDDRLAYSCGAHAEEMLLHSVDWRVAIPGALENWEDGDSPIVVTIALNRSPCSNCVLLLTNALSELHMQFPWRAERNRFILASRGVYEDAAMVHRTTRNDLIRLWDAGWELCVLQTGGQLSPRGRILLEGIESIAGRGFVRLG